MFSFSNTNINYYYYPINNSNYVSSFYGVRELFGKYNFHNGIDIPAIINTPVQTIQNGLIKYIGFDANGYGNYIIILHSNSYKSLYGHLSGEYIINIGDKVYAGQTIAYVGPKTLENGMSNGNTTGPHLHFSVYSNNGKTIDPLSLIYKK
jgi:murein DD-endopeptidase MepM/ murein hydrolase activator NlpD